MLEINRFLRANPDVPISVLSKEISGDPKLLPDVRRGRELRLSTEEKLKQKFSDYLQRRKAN